MKIIKGCIVIFVTMPIWYFLLYQILVRVNASELMWFLYWGYLPFSLFINLLAQVDD